MYNHQKACISELSAYFRPFKWLPADSAGNGQILNCSCQIACPLFFLNFIFRFTSIHFIIDTSEYPHDSNTRHERSRPRIRLDFQISTRNSKKIKIMENLLVASLYVTQLPQKNIIVVRKFYWKSVLRNLLSRMNIHSFQDEGAMFWPHS